MLSALAGCASGPAPAGASAEMHLLPPIQPPPDFDRKRALTPLAQIPDDPPAPAPKPAGERPKLPAPAARLLEEARQLFLKGQHSESTAALEKVLSYEPELHEAHRLMALVCLQSGDDARARLSAERALAIRPDDLVCHYVLGRLAEKQRETDKAIRAYRTALKCRVSPADDVYLTLINYHLGMLLDQQRYYLAASEQFAMFERRVQLLGPRVRENGELATISRLQRGPTAVRLARAYSYLGEYARAATALGVAVGQMPKDLDLRGDYVRMLVHAGRLKEAMAESRRYLADSQGSRDAVELLLAVHRVAGRPQDGVAAIRDIVARQTDNLELALLYSDALVDARQYDQAVRTLTDLVARYPKSTEARWKLISIQRLREAWPDWLLSLAEMLATDPAEYVRANQELDRIPAVTAERIVSEGTSARGKLRKLVPAEPSDSAVASGLDYLLGRLCDRLERVDDARHFFDQAVRRTPGFLPGIIGVAELYVERCRWDDAIDVLQEASQAQERSSHLVERLLGQCYDGLDDAKQAITHYQAAIKINREDTRSMMLLARLYERLDQSREAQQQYQAVITLAPDDVAAREAYIRNLMTSDAGFTSAVAAGRVALEFAEMQRRGPRDPATIRVAALLKFLQDRDRDAYCNTLRTLIQMHPDDERTREDLAAKLLTFRDYEPARQVLNEMIERFPRSGQAGWMMAMVLTRMLDFEGAAGEFQRILRLHPNRQMWLQNLAELRMTEQNYEAAIPLWNRLLAMQDKGEFPGIYRGRLMEAYRRAGQFDEARRVADRWLSEVDAKSRTAGVVRSALRWFLLAADQAQKDYDGYIRRCRGWLKADPRDASARTWLIGLVTEAPLGTVGQFRGFGGLVGAKRYDEAETQVLRWLSEAPADTPLMRSLAEVLLAGRRFDEAIELTRSLASAGGKAEDRLVLLYALQSMYVRAKRYDEAMATVREWINVAQKLIADNRGLSRMDLEGAIFDQRRTTATLMVQAGRVEDALAFIQSMLEQEKDGSRQVELLRALSYIYQRQGQPALAEENLRQAYHLMPADIGLNNDLGYTLAEAGKDLPEAERMLRMVVGENPRQAAYLDSLGWVLYRRGKLKEARMWMTLAAGQEQGEDAVIYDHLGDVLWGLSEKDQAVKNWQRSLELYERQVTDGLAEPNPQLVPSLKSKIEAAANGKMPAVAPIVERSSSAPALR
jgi:tetratricopeptide (TPR) repeat protein